VIDSSGPTASKIADLDKSLVTARNKPNARIPCSVSFDPDLLERFDAKCTTLRVERSRVIRELIRIWLQEPTEPKDQKQEEQSQPQESPNDRKYLTDLKKQWPTLSQEQREAHMRIITRSYGPAGQDFLQHLGDTP